MKIGFLILLLLSLSACFKYAPKKETVRLAGSWKITEAKIQHYATDGSDSASAEVSDLGLLHFHYTEDLMYNNSFGQTISSNYQNFNGSTIRMALDAANIWWVSVDSKNLGFGNQDSETGFVTVIATFTMEKQSNRKFRLTCFTTYPNGKLRSFEAWKFERD